MSTINSSTPLPQYITIMIQITAKKQVGRYGYTESDRDDLEQQIAMEVVRRREKFDSRKAQENTFLARLVTHAVADIIAARKAGNRDYRREEGSLDQWVQNGAGCWNRRTETVTEDEAGQRVGRASASHGNHHDLAIDLADAASKLSPRLREIFDHYKVLGSARNVAAAVGLHPSSVCDALKQIKQHFAAAGLDVYLSKPRGPNPTDSGACR